MTSGRRTGLESAGWRHSAPSIRDVAAAAGVSYQTVSRVLNGSPRVAPLTRERVLDRIRELDYLPNRAARALSSGRAKTVTIVTSNTTLYGYAATLQGMEEAARSNGFGVGVWVVESNTPAAVRAAIQHVRDPAAGAVMVIAFDRAAQRVYDALPAAIPAAAAAEPQSGEPREATVWISEKQVAADATAHLLGLGHRTVHHVPTPSSRRSGRTAGWRVALLGAGAAVPPARTPGWDARAGYRAGLALAQDRDVTAVFCGNDDLALGVLRALHEVGRRVPEDVSLVGFDDSPPARFWTPALTTVRMDFVSLGRACFAAVRARVDGEEPPRLVLPEPRLVVRESTGPAPR